MLTALFTGHELPDFDADLERQLGKSELFQDGPAHRIGFLSNDGKVYRVVLCHHDDECRRVEIMALNAGLQEFEAVAGYIKVFGRATSAAS